MRCPLCNTEKRRLPALAEHLWLRHENEFQARMKNPEDPVVNGLPDEVVQQFCDIVNLHYH